MVKFFSEEITFNTRINSNEKNIIELIKGLKNVVLFKINYLLII